MSILRLDLDEQDNRELREAAQRVGLTPEALARRWIEERLLHERERAAGGGRDVRRSGDTERG
jgi:hypothetical protein